MEPLIQTVARKIADEVLAPAAAEVERSGRIPAAHLDLLAGEGLYGLAAPPDVTGVEPADFPAICRVVETLAGADLATTFVWVQHHSAVMAATRTPHEAVREQWLGPLARGERRAGLAIGAAVRPGPATLRATAVPGGGYRFDGEASWITGWGLVDTLYVAARDQDDTLVWALLDAEAGEHLGVERLPLAAVDATNTVLARFDGLVVPAERVTATMPLEQWRQQDPHTLRFNGSLPLGVAARAAGLAGSPALLAEVDAVRAELDGAGPDTMPAARAAAAHLALRAAATLAVQTGSRAALAGAEAGRLVREATFLLVFGSRPGIRDGLLERLARP